MTEYFRNSTFQSKRPQILSFYPYYLRQIFRQRASNGFEKLIIIIVVNKSDDRVFDAGEYRHPLSIEGVVAEIAVSMLELPEIKIGGYNSHVVCKGNWG